MKTDTDSVSFDGGSFRDPAGFVFSQGETLYRQVNLTGKKDFDFFISCGLYDKLSGEGLIVAHSEVALSGLPADRQRYKVLKPMPIPFISYPYEWTFPQLKAAAGLTLKIQEMALAKGMILKDASAYNIQFIGRRPIFIDTLSFRIYQPGAPWDGYKQFCEHFVAPLAVASHGTPDVLRMQKSFMDGIPLATATKMLPGRTKLRRGLAIHLYLHLASQKKFGQPGKDSTKTPRITPIAMAGLIASLNKTINKLNPPKQNTQWGNYYSDTNYSETAFKSKKRIVTEFIGAIKPKPRMVWDLGANDGTFSEIAARNGAYVVSFDIDPQAVELNYVKHRDLNMADMILPLSQDLTNPSPALGWAHNERRSLAQRGPADVILALALVHHLAIGNNLPLGSISEYFSKLGKSAIVEFVPRSDSKAKILLHRRAQLFSDYTPENFESALNQFFQIIKKKPVAKSQRVIYLCQSKSIKKNG